LLTDHATTPEIQGTNLIYFADGEQDDLLYSTHRSHETLHHPNAIGEQEHMQVETCCYMDASIPPEQQTVGSTPAGYICAQSLYRRPLRIDDQSSSEG
jgi:hypothetical protein